MISKKASRSATELARLMLNVRSPCQSNRRLSISIFIRLGANCCKNPILFEQIEWWYRTGKGPNNTTAEDLSAQDHPSIPYSFRRGVTIPG